MGLRLRLLACGGVLATGAAGLPASAQDLGHNNVTEVVVTASPVQTNADKLATIVQSVDRDQVLANGGASLGEALRDVPGVSATGFAAGASRPVIRGMDAQRVKLVENGLSSSDVSDVGPDHGVPIDPLVAQRIEVVRGAATLRYGSQAIGGVINVINNRIPLTPTQGVHGEATGAYSSVSSSGEGDAMVDAGSGPFAVHFDGFGRTAGDYDVPGGEQPNSFFHGNGYSGGASYFFGQDMGDRAGGDYTHYEARYGIPSDDTFIKMKQDKGAFSSSLKLGTGPLDQINTDVSYADYRHDEVDPDTGEALSTFLNKEWDGRMEALFGQIGPFSGSAVGVQVQDRKFSGLGEANDYLEPTHTKSVAGFAFVEAPAGGFDFQGALRVEHVSISGTPASGALTDRDFTPVSVSGGFTYDVAEGVRLGLNLASAARAPAQTELFARGPHDGPLTFETGNPDLKIERANSIEGSLRYSFGEEGRIEASVWGAKFDNYIFGELTGRTCDEDGNCSFGGGEELKELNYTQRDAEFWGAELKGFVPVAKAMGGQLSVQALGDYVRARFTHGGGDVPRIQPGRIGGGLDWASERIDASFLVLAVSGQHHVGLADPPVEGYTAFDAQVAWRPFTGRPGVEFLLIGHNLANEEIRDATALNKDVVLQPGRDIRFVVRTKF